MERAADPVTVARRVSGVHAQVASSAHVAAAARMEAQDGALYRAGSATS